MFTALGDIVVVEVLACTLHLDAHYFKIFEDLHLTLKFLMTMFTFISLNSVIVTLLLNREKNILAKTSNTQ